MTTVRAALSAAAERLAAAGVLSPRTDAELLLAEVLGLERLSLITEPGRELSAAEEARLAGLLARRAAREPLQYLLARAGFMGLEFACDRRALIPRPVTARLAERALEILEQHARKGRPARVLELGTGSGCVVVALAVLAPAGSLAEPGIWATDISAEALALARENAALHGVERRFAGFFQGDLYAALPAASAAECGERNAECGMKKKEHASAHSSFLIPHSSFDLILANPPYVREADHDALAPEIREHEPPVAVDGGEDGLVLVRRFVAGLPAHLAPGGSVLMEMADGQWPSMRRLLTSAGLEAVRVWKDLGGVERVAEGVRG